MKMMQVRMIAVMIVVCFWNLAGFAQDFLPTAFPDRVVLTLADDPAHAIAVTWRTDTSIAKGVVEVRKAGDSPDMETGVRRMELSPERLESGDVSANYFSTVIRDLDPMATYVYRVGNTDHWSEWFQFTTASSTAGEFSFLYLGDGQNDLKSKWSRSIREAYKMVPDARFILHAGDLINRSGVDREWGEWHYAAGFIQSMVPVMATPGNHEYKKDETGKMQFDTHWRAGFNFPLNGPAGLEETAYYVDYQDARLISLNSQMITLDSSFRMAEYRWLEKVLQESASKWKIITFHHPVYSTAEGRDNPELRELFRPLFEKYGVHLVLQGHDHTYGRGTGKPGRTKPVYIVSVSGPKMYKPGDNKWMEKFGKDTQLFQKITIKGNQLFYKSYTVTGALFDEFVMDK